MQNNTTRRTKSICIASGKGGVGKTSVSVNLALALASMDYKVLLFDGDMGLANTQIALGCTLPDNFSSNPPYGRFALPDIVLKTRFGIDLLPGTNGNMAMAALDREQTLALVREFATFGDHYDFLLTDAAAGVSPGVLALLEASDLRVVVGTNEPASITDAYGLIKAMSTQNIAEQATFVSNRTVQAEGKRLFDKMEHVVRFFLNAGIRYGGSISDDPFMGSCWRKGEPIVHAAPHSMVAHELMQLARTLSEATPVAGSEGAIRFFG